ncbi:hypothetical protein [uncultured Sulfitobacter sp.]|uniref:calcium-binding protein n=1 Tax=uncultured Sulfitobacter sp. TaxID=191468 RepID=UPI00260411B2|nr:hypothetical protein [uncultured Sulfitobacter sp.]
MIQAPGFLPVTENATANTNTISNKSNPEIAALADGGFVLVWESEEQDGDGKGIFGQRVDAAGDKVGGEFQVNTFTFDEQDAPSVTPLADGGFVVTWASAGQSLGEGEIYGQRFDTEGAKAGTEFKVSGGGPSFKGGHDIVSTADGGFYVAWESTAENGNAYTIDGQAFDADGNAEGPRHSIVDDGNGTRGLQNLSLSQFDDGQLIAGWSESTFAKFKVFETDGSAVGDTFSFNSNDRYINNSFNATPISDTQFIGEWTNPITSRSEDFESGFSTFYRIFDIETGSISEPLTREDREPFMLFNGSLAASAVGETLPAYGETVSTRLPSGQYAVAWSDGQYAQFADDNEPGSITYRLLERNQLASGSATIGGDAFAGETLTAVVEGFDDPDGVVSVNYQWYVDDAPINGATDLSYVVQDEDSGKLLEFKATLIDGNGTAETLTAENPVIVGKSILGTSEGDSLSGTQGHDRIEGQDGNDTISGLGGDDTLSGGGGADFIVGDFGDDTLQGGAGNDTIRGELGDDTLDGGAGDDIVNGGDGDDSLSGGAGNDEISGADGHDTINPGIGRDTIYLASDVVTGALEEIAGDHFFGFGISGAMFIQDATLNGSAETSFDGESTVFLQPVAGERETVSFTVAGDVRTNGFEFKQIGDTIGFGNFRIDPSTDGAGRFELSGNDLPNNVFAGGRTGRLVGGNGDDEINGRSIDYGSGTLNDLIYGNAGNDTLKGFAGLDTVVGGEGDDRILGGLGNDRLIGHEGRDTLFGEQGDDQIFGGDDADMLQGGIGNDTLFGGSGDDTLNGSADNDELFGEDGHDRLLGSDGNDRVIGGAGDDSIDGGNGTDTLNGGGGDDTIIGGTDMADLRDNIFGGAGNDSIDGGYGNDLIYGQEGDDTIEGGFGADTVQGQDGDDVLTGSAFGDNAFGGDGDDFINGGFGNDLLNGGHGADEFFHIGGGPQQMRGHGSDWIQDFDAAEGDVLVFGGTASVEQFQVNFTHTANLQTGERSGEDNVEEAFVIYRPTGQILWALVDGAAQDEINLMIQGDSFDLLA